MKLGTTIFRSIILTAAVFMFGLHDSHGESLYVFMPSKFRPIAMQNKMREACPGIDIMVFGRHKDFDDQVKANKPDAILTKPAVIEHIGGYMVSLKGKRKGAVRESHVLLSVDKKTDLNNIGKLKIGVFDILGRKGMKGYIGRHFNPAPKLKRVSKMEDLLQMLTFNMADAVLVPKNDVSYFREISNLNFVVTPVQMKTGIISLAKKDGTGASKITGAIKKTAPKNMALPEVDAWE